MSLKILVADDSLTIQKVIAITLANSGYVLTESLKEDDLLKKISSEKYDLVLLDFNLSDSKTGYDLSREIKIANPDTAIIVMLGTFDTIDEAQFDSFGINDKIIKPFESSKFIKKCKDVLESKTSKVFEIRPKEQENHKVNEVQSSTPVNDIDSWVVDPLRTNHAAKTEEIVEEKFENITELKSEALDPLHSEIKGWGFDPAVNIEEKFNKVFPPVIDLNEVESNLEHVKHEVIERLQSSSTFVAEISDQVEIEDIDSTDPAFEIPQDLNRDILSSIDDDVSAEAFWAVDEVLPLKSEESENIEETNLDEITADLTDTVNTFKLTSNYTPYQGLDLETPIEVKKEVKLEAPTTSSQNIDINELVAKLKIELLPQIEKMVREYCRESAEKVSWEVIPDLAENLIKKEIKEITDSINRQ